MAGPYTWGQKERWPFPPASLHVDSPNRWQWRQEIWERSGGISIGHWRFHHPRRTGHMQICVTKACDTFGGQVLSGDIVPADQNLEALEPKSLSWFLRSSQIELKKKRGGSKDEPSKTIVGQCHSAKDRMDGQESNRACTLCPQGQKLPGREGTQKQNKKPTVFKTPSLGLGCRSVVELQGPRLVYPMAPLPRYQCKPSIEL